MSMTSGATAGRQAIRNAVAQAVESARVHVDVAFPAERADQGEALLGTARRENRDLDVDTTGTLQIDLDQIGPARREHPHNPPAVGRTAHLFGDHSVDAP